MATENNQGIEAVRSKSDLPPADPFGIPAWKRPLYHATDVVESYLDVFESTRLHSGPTVKKLAFIALVVIVMTTIVVWNVRNITIFTP